MMWRVVFAWFVALWSLCMAEEAHYRIDTIEGKYPYGITIETKSTRVNTPDEHETIMIYQDGKLVDRIETFRVYPREILDLDRNGYKELIFDIFDGSRTFDRVIVTIKPHMPKPTVFKGMAESSRILHIDGKPRLQTWENYGALYSAERAVVTVYADFNGTHFHLNKSLQHRAFAILKIPQQTADIFLKENGFLGTHRTQALMEIIAYIVHAWYAGESEKAIALLHRRLHPSDNATMYLFLQELVDELSQSRFWNDIVAFNEWQEDDYEIVGEVLMHRYRNLDKDDIVRALFEQIVEKRDDASNDRGQ